ncbi:hypothetical protein CK203_089026 [Vitis vinifera]|uniref:DUF1664 domain-containing protein n=1 Tax=Vitis vinifera TaxID=29760 RepID=A0A438BQV1_VITVI|nr:hypothetical protein CK203_089026 [Vitis vinifera]
MMVVDIHGHTFMCPQIRQLAQEIRELTVSNPVTFFNGNSGSSGSYASYIMPAAALGAMGYCYMWWKARFTYDFKIYRLGLSFSDVMFVTKHNMANAVATVSKQLEHVSEAVVSTKRHLSKRLENLDWKLEEQKETSKLIANDVHEVKSDLFQIGFDVEMIQQMVSGLEGKLELLESKQDMTNSGLWYLCQAAAGGIKDGLNAKLFQDVGDRIPDHSAVTYENSLKGLQFIADTNESSTIKKSGISSKETNPNDGPVKRCRL